MSLLFKLLPRSVATSRPLLTNSRAVSDISNLFEQAESNRQQPEPAGQQSRYENRQNNMGGGEPRTAFRRMNKGINRVELLGGVAGDPLVKQTQRGGDFASFNLYTNVDHKSPNGELVTNVEVHNIVAFGGVAKYVANNLQRGSRVFLTGRLHYTGGQLLADGTRTPRMASINLEHVYPLFSRARQQQQDLESEQPEQD